jgi:hypothetical protein
LGMDLVTTYGRESSLGTRMSVRVARTCPTQEPAVVIKGRTKCQLQNTGRYRTCLFHKRERNSTVFQLLRRGGPPLQVQSKVPLVVFGENGIGSGVDGSYTWIVK